MKAALKTTMKTAMNMSTKKFTQKFVFILLICSSGILAAAELKVGVVDVQAAIEASHHFSKIKTTLDREFAPIETDLKSMNNSIIALEERLMKDSAIMGESESRRLQQEINQKKSSLKFESYEAQRKLTARQQELTYPVLKLAEEAVTEIVKEKNYDLILPQQTVVHFRDEYNLTKLLTEKLNQKK